MHECVRIVMEISSDHEERIFSQNFLYLDTSCFASEYLGEYGKFAFLVPSNVLY